MNDSSLAQRFEEQRPHLRAVAYRMLGSVAEAEDAVQESWLRLSGADARAIENLGGWLTTVVGRICLNVLRSRATHPEQELSVHTPDPVVSRVDAADPEQAAMLGESVGLAMLVVLDALTPAERLAFVLHDVFAVPFDEIADILDATPAATRQLASRARRRVQSAPTPDTDLVRQRAAVDAFFAAARGGDFAALVAVLDPDVVLRSDGGLTRKSATYFIRGAETLASQALGFADGASLAQPAIVNGAAGVVIARGKHLLSVMGFVVRGGKIVSIDVLSDPVRMTELGLQEWAEEPG